MKTAARILLTLILVAAGCVGGYELWDYYMFAPWTRDARVQADVVSIAPDVSGFVDEVRVKDNQFVHKGDILVVLDRERYSRALATAAANVAALKAQMDMRQHEAARRVRMPYLPPTRPQHPISRRSPTARRLSSTSTGPSCARRSTGLSLISPSKSVSTLRSAQRSWR